MYVCRVFGCAKYRLWVQKYTNRVHYRTRHDVVMNLGMWCMAYEIGAGMTDGDRYEFNECERWYKNRSFGWESRTLSVPTIYGIPLLLWYVVNLQILLKYWSYNNIICMVNKVISLHNKIFIKVDNSQNTENPIIYEFGCPEIVYTFLESKNLAFKIYIVCI